MKRIIIALSLPLIIATFWRCESNSLEKSAETNPVIKNVTFSYSELNKSLFIAAAVTDPQGWENIDSVAFTLYQIDTVSSETGQLFLSGRLSDDGPPADIITQDGVFSYLIDSAGLGGYEGYYRGNVRAYDADGNLSDSVTATELVQANSPPDVFILSAPTTFEKGDTLKFYARVSDLQGYDDIAAVPYSILRPDGEYFNRFFSLHDDGVNGDELARDGIFTVFQPSNANSVLQGLYVFYFFAQDYSGAISDTIKVRITNPGVHVTEPAYSSTLHYGDNLHIAWESAYISQVKLEYSYNANISAPTWNTIATVVAALGEYNWVVPSGSTTNYCKIRVSDITTSKRNDVNDNYLVIAP